jgi:ASC-1-like (ASCH) protein
MTDRTARVNSPDLYSQYFELAAAGTKTLEIRLKYPHLVDLVACDTTRSHIKGIDETCDVNVLRVTEYLDFEASSTMRVRQTSISSTRSIRNSSEEITFDTLQRGRDQHYSMRPRKGSNYANCEMAAANSLIQPIRNCRRRQDLQEMLAVSFVATKRRCDNKVIVNRNGIDARNQYASGASLTSCPGART